MYIILYIYMSKNGGFPEVFPGLQVAGLDDHDWGMPRRFLARGSSISLVPWSDWWVFHEISWCLIVFNGDIMV